MIVLFACSWTFVFIECFKFHPEAIVYLLQNLLIFLGCYSRFRKQMLGQQAFLAVAAIEPNQGALTWKEVMNGFNLQMIQLTTEQNQLKVFGNYASGASGLNPFSQTLAQTQALEKGNFQPIFNRFSNRNEVVFPFFYYTARRQMTVRSAFKTLYNTTLNAFGRAPVETTLAVGSTVGVTVGATVQIGLQQQTIAQKDKELVQKDKELVQREELHREAMVRKDKELVQKERELDLLEKELDTRLSSGSGSAPDHSTNFVGRTPVFSSSVLEKKDVALVEAAATAFMGPELELLPSARIIFDILESI